MFAYDGGGAFDGGVFALLVSGVRLGGGGGGFGVYIPALGVYLFVGSI